MDLRSHFIQATTAYNDIFGERVPAPCIRKAFTCDATVTARLTVSACGFYDLFVNGARLTKGRLAPYICNAGDFIYADTYEIPLEKGENVIGFLLGNGFLNNPGGYIWDFDKTPLRSAPMVSMELTYTGADGQTVTVVTGEDWKTAPSAIRSDDYRFGETYDARYEAEGWTRPGFDDTAWVPVHRVIPPAGEIRLCEAAPIVVEKELKPTRILPCQDGYIYDFGESNAGVCRLTVNAREGQTIRLQHADWLNDAGELSVENIWFVRENWARDGGMIQCDTYTGRGGLAVWEPTFTYHGFRYVHVTGITPDQATPDLLTFVVFHTRMESRGGFTCSDETANRLQEITRRSDLSNFHYFPTDCPQREKNGWTADAALSAEQLLLNFNPETSYREWMRNICKAQNEAGALPGVIPTYGWGFAWGNGPAWDSVLAYIPYYVYLYRGDTSIIRESAPAFTAYLRYLLTRRDEKGLLHIGLGDWCEINQPGPTPTAPLELTDTLMALDIARKMAVLFGAVGMTDEAHWADGLADEYRAAVRAHLVDFTTMTAAGDCQSSQAMALYYGIFEEQEKPAAFARLLAFVHAADDHMQVGVLGGRVLFHVLSDFGETDLAYRMITRPDFPSYGEWIRRGATTLWESFHPASEGPLAIGSMNHHFWGDISSWFIQNLAGIRFNPRLHHTNEADLRPTFVEALNAADGHHDAPLGRIRSAWKRAEDGTVAWTVEVPAAMKVTCFAPAGWSFADGSREQPGRNGVFRLQKD